MNRWEAALTRVSRRSISEAVETLAVEPPFAFNFAEAVSEMPGLIAEQVEDKQPPHEIIIDLPDRDVTLATDMLVCITKFLHVVQCCRANARRGALTWGIVDAYHAAILGARAVGATMGVIPYVVSGRSFLVDFRPEVGTPQDRIKFRKTYGRHESPILVLSPRPAHFEQNDQWKLLIRLLRFAAQNYADPARLQVLIDAADRFPGEVRNLVVYDSLKWIWRGDSSSLSQETLSSAAIAELLAENPCGTDLLDGLYSLLQDQFNTLTAKLDLSATAVPRAIELRPAPRLLAA